MRQVKQHDHLESSLRSKIERHFSTGTDVLEQFLIDKRNPRTRKAYSDDLNDFFKATTGIRGRGE